MSAYPVLFLYPEHSENKQTVIDTIEENENIVLTHNTFEGLKAEEIPTTYALILIDYSSDIRCQSILSVLRHARFQNCSLLFFIDPKDEPSFKEQCSAYQHHYYLLKPLHLNQLQHHITQQMNLHAKELLLRHEKELVEQIIEGIPSPVFITDGHTLTFANGAFYSFFDISSIDSFDKTYGEITSIFKEKEKIFPADSQAWKNLDQHESVILKNHADKEMVVKAASTLTNDLKYIITTQDITQEYDHAQELETLYFNDRLTSLPNRTKLLNDMHNIPVPEYLAMAIFDIDNFKEINGLYGHGIGDFVINSVSKRIESFLTDDEMLLYRLPADSFALLSINNLEKEYFETVVHSVVQLITREPFIYDQDDQPLEIDVSISAGIAFGADNALAKADIALRTAKSSHSHYMVYKPSLSHATEYQSNLLWIRKTKEALKSDNIVPYFQPIINNETKQIEKYECLARLIDDNNEAIPPFYFLDIAKRTRLYESITQTIIAKSIEHFSKLPYEFSINLSIEDIKEHNVIDFLKKMLQLYPVADRLVFEILETEEIKDYAQMAAFVKELKELGCKVAIDDFGSGYSNFSHLINLDFDYVKIDSSLIKNIHNEPEKQIILKTVIAFAEAINTKTIAEYVESEEIYDYVSSLGIDYSQGYHFGKPAPLTTSKH